MKEKVYIVIYEYMGTEKVKAVFKDLEKARKYLNEKYLNMGEYPFEMYIDEFEIEG